MSKFPLVPVHYIAQIRDYLESQGQDTAHWLRNANLNASDVIEDATMLDYRVYERLILRAIELVKHQDLGLRIGQRLLISSHGALGFAFLNCATLEEVLKLFSRYLSTRTPLIKLEVTQKDHIFQLNLIELYDTSAIRKCFLEAVVMSVFNALNFVFEHKNLMIKVKLPYPAPKYADQYVALLNCPVEFDSPNTSIWLNDECLTNAVKPTDQHSLHQALQICDVELQKSVQLQTISARVRLLLMSTKGEFLSLEQVAEKLSMTTRTLHRKLAREQQSYKNILQDVRHTLAKQYLNNQNNSIKQVAYLLGYEDVANFRRAFKRWQGLSPQQYRQLTK